jgi:cytochrome P450
VTADGEDAAVDFDTVDIFTDPALVDDPFPYLEHLRRTGPVARLPRRGVVAVTGYDTAAEVWRDGAAFSSCNAVTGPFPRVPLSSDGEDASASIEEHRHEWPMHEYLVTQDPPAHTAQRGLLMRLLTPKRMQENEAFMLEMADRQLDAALAPVRFEVLADFARPYTLLVIADLLGVPREDHDVFKMQLGAGQPGSAADEQRRAVAKDPLAFLFETFTGYVEDRRRAPRADVLTQLATATFPDGRVPEVADVVHTATFLFSAGQETTATLIATALRTLGDDRELQALLRAEPARIPDFLEEVLRLDGPVKTVNRVTRRATRLGDMEIAAGTVVAVYPHAANRDPGRFESPDAFRMDRPNTKEHLAFGRGIHSCPGGPLARVEARVALERLLDRTSDIRISDAHHGPPGRRTYRYEPTYILRGLQELHVECSQ